MLYTIYPHFDSNKILHSTLKQDKWHSVSKQVGGHFPLRK